MKQIIFVTVLMFMLSGCYDTYNSATPKMNSTELTLVDSFDTYYKIESLTPFLKSVSKRKDLAKEGETPFCDVLNSLELLDQRLLLKGYKKEYVITTQWKSLKGESLRESCFGDKTSSEISNSVVTISVEKDKVLSPDIMDQLIASVEKCFTAKVKMIDIVDEKGYLTREDYTEVMKTISKCKMSELKQEIDKQ